jgi:hypothetical protein
MHSTGNFTIDYGEPNNWSSLFVDPLNKFKIWKRHATDMSTRYLRLSLTDPYAAVNEILFMAILYLVDIQPLKFGKSKIKKQIEKATFNEYKFDSEHIEFYPNPVDEILNIKFPIKMTGKIILVKRYIRKNNL